MENQLKTNDVVVIKAGPDWKFHKIISLNENMAEIELLGSGVIQSINISWLREPGEKEKAMGYREVNGSNFTDKQAHFWSEPLELWQERYAKEFCNLYQHKS